MGCRVPQAPEGLLVPLGREEQVEPGALKEPEDPQVDLVLMEPLGDKAYQAGQETLGSQENLEDLEELTLKMILERSVLLF